MAPKPLRPPADVYEVGYGKPPKATRYPKGVSGNPSGKSRSAPRPKSAVEKVLDRGVMMNIDGKRQRVRLNESLLLQLYKQGLQGNVAASREFNRAVERIREVQRRDFTAEPDQPPQLMISYAPSRVHGALEVLEMVTVADGGRMTLNLSEVARGVSRLGRPLTDREQMVLRVATVGFDDWYSEFLNSSELVRRSPR